MKNKLWLLTIVGIVFFSACGGGSSKEAKELQQKMIKIVGIPQGIIANICQDDNTNGFCEETELQAKVSFDQGDSMQDILSKLTLTGEGRYLLETYDPSKPLLLELKDGQSQYFTDSFILPFNGFKNNEDEKELSILQSMIDKDFLTPSNVSSVRVMKNVDDFYKMLLSALEENIDALKKQGSTTKEAVAENIKGMAETLIKNGIENTVPTNVNNCNGEQTCVDDTLNVLFRELVVTNAVTNKAPTANAGEDKVIIVNQTVTLIGKGTDSDGTIVDYEWKKGSDVLATTASFDYTPTIIGTDILTLIVTDNDGVTNSDEIKITVKEIQEENKIPIANAGEDKSVTINQSITIAGTGTDSDGTISAYEWKKDDVVLADTASFIYSPTVIGEDILTFTVTDSDGLKSSSDSMVVTVKKEVTPVVNGKIDLANYYPNRSMTKNYMEKWKFKDEDKGKTATVKEEITLKNNTISIKTTYSDDEDIDTDITTINKNSITYEWNDGKNSTVSNRYVNIGDITFEDTNSYTKCTLVGKLTTFSHGDYSYSGDIIKEKCITSYGNSLEYRKKDLGLVASIDDGTDSTYDYSNWYYIK